MKHVNFLVHNKYKLLFLSIMIIIVILVPVFDYRASNISINTEPSNYDLDFLYYESSRLEKLWLKNNWCDDPCSHVDEDLIAILEEQNNFNNINFYSRMVYRKNGALIYDYIEPLVGTSRLARYCLNDSNLNFLLSLDYLHRSKLFYKTCEIFDFGSTPFFGSSSWLWTNLSCEIKDIYAFEITKIDPNIILNWVPHKLRKMFHWWNLKVDSQTLINFFKGDTDLTIIKLDIDDTEVELSILKTIVTLLTNSKTSCELFFEHHVYNKEMVKHWGNATSSHCESVDLFKSLRLKGIRSHYWI
jgi:hypothetical protein